MESPDNQVVIVEKNVDKVDSTSKAASASACKSARKEEDCCHDGGCEMACTMENSKEDRISAAQELTTDEVLSVQFNIKDSPTDEQSSNLEGKTVFNTPSGEPVDNKPSSSAEKGAEAADKSVATATATANGQNSADESSECQIEHLHEFQKHQSKPVNRCPHKDRKHYAKNMCSSCYRRFGRNQNATKCGHPDRLLYSMGMCQTCYMADYHQRRTKPMKKLIQKQIIKHGLHKDLKSEDSSKANATTQEVENQTINELSVIEEKE